MEHKIELLGGYVDKDGVIHDEVIFGRRLTGKDLMDLDNHPQAANPTQYQDLIRRRMITKFGALQMPVSLDVLLSLDSIDREDLTRAADKFMELSRGTRASDFRDNNEVKLFFGFEIEGTFYDVVQFGNRITGNDEVAADAVGQGVSRLCFLQGRQISRISTSDGALSIAGTVELDKFNSLDAEDMNLLRIGAELAKVSFRIKGKKVSGKRNGSGRVSAGKGNANERSGDSNDADRSN